MGPRTPLATIIRHRGLELNSRAKSDLFNIRPIDINVNSSRGNKYYDISTPPVSSYPESPDSTYDSNSWEPRIADKGSHRPLHVLYGHAL